MVEKLNEDYINKWSIIEFIVNFLVIMFFSYVAGIFVIYYIAVQFHINSYLYFSFLTNYIVPIIFIIIIKLRKRIINHLINKANRNEEPSLLYNHQKRLFIIQTVLSVSTLIIIFLNKAYSDIITNNSLLLITSITLLYMPIYFTFSTILTEAGFVFIEFNEFNLNIHNFEKRQHWLKKISDIFKKGNMYVNKDELRSKFNLQMRNSVDITLKINDMKNWFLSEDKTDDLFSIFGKIWPTVMPEPYKRLKWHERIDLFPPYQYVKMIIGSIIAIIFIIQDPTLLYDIFNKIMDKFL